MHTHIYVGNVMILMCIVTIAILIVSLIYFHKVRKQLRRLTVDTPTRLEFHHNLGETGTDHRFRLTWRVIPDAVKYRVFGSRKRHTELIHCEFSTIVDCNEIYLPYFPHGPWYFKVDAVNKERIVSLCSKEAKLEKSSEDLRKWRWSH
jgi:hypothetical protein